MPGRIASFGIALFVVLCALKVASAAAAVDPQSSQPFVVAQRACQQRNLACGAGHNVGPCCPDLWCQNGSCQQFQQVGEPCGTSATPPCEPGLACGTDGRCQRLN